MGKEVGLDLQWQSVGVSEQAVVALITEEPSLRELPEVEHDAGAPGTQTLVLRYLQEVGTVPLLTAVDEVRLAEPLRAVKALLLEALQSALSAVAIPPELTPEA